MRYDTHVFLGPTLPLSIAKQHLPEAYYHPPICWGELTKLLRLAPKHVIIIDGYYESMPAVWHKEIMLALTNDVEVWGASSMGALRAAELSSFGMQGVGEIFQAFLTQQLVDDDEVAVIHHGVEKDYLPINDAMVNIRATIREATSQQIITPAFAESLLQHCKAMFYPYRSKN